jgi:hypothetical protein
MGKGHKGSSLINFQQRFHSEFTCIEYLAKLRWPKGYKCQKCGCEKAYQLKVEPRVFQCSECRFQESVTAGTLLHRTRTPLVKWFWAAYLLSQDKRGISAKQLSRELDLHYATAWTMLHKLRRALCDKGAFPLTGVVEVDETYYGGKGGLDSRGRSLNNKNKALIVMAVERKLAKPEKMPGIKKAVSWRVTQKWRWLKALRLMGSGRFSKPAWRLAPTCSAMGGLLTHRPEKDSSMNPSPRKCPPMPEMFCPLSISNSTTSNRG